MKNEAHLLTVENLSVDFYTRDGVVHAVRDVGFTLDRSETLAILGESGSGKSVSASAIMGLIDMPPGRIVSGRAVFDGQDLLTAGLALQQQVNGRRIAMIFQDPLAALNPVYTVGWQLAEMFRIHSVDVGNRRAEAIRLLDRVGIPDAAQRVDFYPHQFSGGQRQRVMIAMAIALKPDIIIADEPTTALDVTIQAQILRLLKDLQKENGMGLLLITHDLAVVAEVADRVVVMQNGEIVETGPLRTVFRYPAHPYTRRLLNTIPGRHGYTARDVSMQAEPLLEVRGVDKVYGQFQALKDVSLTLREGQTLGIVGESGSGKSTLAKAILGLEEPTTGKIFYRNREISSLPKDETFALRRKIQVVFQDPTASLNPYMSVSEIISEPWAIHKGSLAKAEWGGRIEDLLVKVGLKPEHARRHPHQFSGGQRQRIAIARALALEPEILLCDEAVSALDVSIQAQVIDLLKKLREDLGLSFIFIAHDLPVIRDFCDEVIVMHKGRIVEQGSTARLFEAPKEAYTQELLKASPLLDSLLEPVEA
jgi:peptide/nickel transport system ATP-binding protein